LIVLAEAVYDDHSGPLQVALFYVDETILAGQGEIRTLSETCDFVKEAGFTDLNVGEFEPEILTMITARKPG
jgi:hypothetical protein